MHDDAPLRPSLCERAEMPSVDVVIPTIGRPSLGTAILAASVQTHPNVRVVVIADQNKTECQRIYHHACYCVPGGNSVYRETDASTGRGDSVKKWYLRQDWIAPFCKFLDDDDWMAPCAVQTMMEAMQEDVVAVTCQMLAVVHREKYRYNRIISGRLVQGQIGGCSALFRTAEAKQVPWPDGPNSDVQWLLGLAECGKFVHLNIPLYVYNGYRTNKERP